MWLLNFVVLYPLCYCFCWRTNNNDMTMDLAWWWELGFLKPGTINFSWEYGESFPPPFFFNNQVRISLGERWGKTFLFLGCHSFYPGISKADQQEMNFSSTQGHPSTTWPESTKRKNRGTNSKYSFIEEAQRKQEIMKFLVYTLQLFAFLIVYIFM